MICISSSFSLNLYGIFLCCYLCVFVCVCVVVFEEMKGRLFKDQVNIGEQQEVINESQTNKIEKKDIYLY